MRAFFARLQRWFAERAERRRRFRAVQQWRNGFADDQHEQVRDRVLVLALLGGLIMAGVGANVIGMASAGVSGPDQYRWPAFVLAGR